MGKDDYNQKQLRDDALDVDHQDDDEHFIEFENLLFDELLCNIKSVQFDDIINTALINDGARVHGTIQCNSLDWLYTADRLNINGKRIYSFRFASPCHPDYYKSFVIKNHPDFQLSDPQRHGLEGWYKYTGPKFPKMVMNYLNIVKVMNKQKPYGPRIFVNNKYERLDIEFDLQSDDGSERITITFEPGYPATP